MEAALANCQNCQSALIINFNNLLITKSSYFSGTNYEEKRTMVTSYLIFDFRDVVKDRPSMSQGPDF